MTVFVFYVLHLKLGSHVLGASFAFHQIRLAFFPPKSCLNYAELANSAYS